MQLFVTHQPGDHLTDDKLVVGHLNPLVNREPASFDLINVSFDRFCVLEVGFFELTDCCDTEGIDLSGCFPCAIALEISVQLFVLQRPVKFILPFNEMIESDRLIAGRFHYIVPCKEHVGLFRRTRQSAFLQDLLVLFQPWHMGVGEGYQPVGLQFGRLLYGGGKTLHSLTRQTVYKIEVNGGVVVSHLFHEFVYRHSAGFAVYQFQYPVIEILNSEAEPVEACLQQRIEVGFV